MSVQENNQQQPGDTGSGFLVGVDPAQPQKAGDWQQGTPAQQVSQPVQVAPPPPQGRQFSEEDIERARQQEKDKLYPRLQTMEEELKALRKERETEAQEKQRLAEEAEAAHRAKEESEMEVKDLLNRREQEWNQRFQSLEQQREADKAVWDQENRLRDLEDYRRSRIEQEAANIIPQLRDFVSGSTPEEIDAAIEVVKERSLQIYNDVVEAQQQPQPRGAALTAPPVGPMEQMPTYETLTPEQIKNMPMNEYKRYRDGLLQAASRQHQQGR